MATVRSLLNKLDELAAEQSLRSVMPQDEIALTTERMNIAGLISLQREMVKILTEISPEYGERLLQASSKFYEPGDFPE